MKEQLKNKFLTFESQLNGEKKSALHNMRRASLELLLKEGLPGVKSESYKYSKITRAISKELSALSIGADTPTPIEVNDIPVAFKPGYHVFYNGHYHPPSSYQSDEEQLRITWNDADTDSLAPSKEQDPFELLNQTFTRGTLTINVCRNAIIDRPLIIVHLNDASSCGVLSSASVHLDIGENAQISVIEFFMGQGKNSSVANSCCSAALRKNANLDLVKIGEDTDQTLRVDNTTVNLSDNARLNSFVFNASGKMIRNNLKVNVDGQNCEAHLNGLYLPAGYAHIDNQTTVDHLQPNSQSNELYKGIITDHARAVFNGRIFVRPDAQKTNAFQSNKNILLAETAKVNTKPQLEIWADDVKCSHGCTTGQLDKEQLFYLQSRGIGKKQSIGLLLKAFSGEVIGSIRNKEAREHIEHLTEHVLTMPDHE